MSIEDIEKLLSEDDVKKLESSKCSIQKIFCSNSQVGTKSLKRWINKLKLKEYVCSVCNQTHHNNLPINLEIDHIDGDNMNNDIDNLRYICQICHSRTDNYKGKNQKRTKLPASDQEMIDALRNNKSIKDALNSLNYRCKSGKNYQRARKLADDNGIIIGNKIHIKIAKLCPDCGIEIRDRSFRCSKCSHIKSQRFDISEQELKLLVWKYPLTKIGIMYSVSDNAIKKRCEKYGVTRPPHGYFLK